jgi:hypothetical protein
VTEPSFSFLGRSDDDDQDKEDVQYEPGDEKEDLLT